MTFAAALVLIALACWARTLVDRWFHPAPLFPLIWGGLLALDACLAGIWVDPLQPEALPIFVIGSVSFVCGAVLVQAGASPAKRRAGGTAVTGEWRINYSKLARVCLALHAVMLPLCWLDLLRISDNAETLLLMAYRVRAVSITGEDGVGGLVGNYLAAGLVVMPLLFVGRASKRISLPLMLLATVPWILTILVAKGRSSLMQFAVASFYLLQLRGGRLPWATVGALALAFVAVFIGGIVLVGKEGVGADSTAFEILGATIENFIGYLLQGSILFGRYAAATVMVAPDWDAMSYVCELAAKVGVCTPGGLHLEENSFTPSGTLGNVYSVYFSLMPRYGNAGVVAFTFFYGAWSAFHHGRAERSLAHSLVAAYLVSAIVISVFNDSFLPMLNLLAKCYVIGAIISYVFKKSGERGSANARTGDSERQIPGPTVPGGAT